MTTQISPAPGVASRESGWYPDPLDGGLLRYWDQGTWTFWTSDVPPPRVVEAAPAQEASPRHPGPRQDIADAEAAAGNLVGARKEIRLLEGRLRVDERVLALAGAQGGAFGGAWGVLVCTNQRVLFSFSGMLSETFIDVEWTDAREVVFDASTKAFEVYTVKRTKRAVPALKVVVVDKADAVRVAKAAGAAAAAPRLDTI